MLVLISVKVAAQKALRILQATAKLLPEGESAVASTPGNGKDGLCSASTL